MDWITISVIFTVLFIFSLLWRLWLNRLLKIIPGKPIVGKTSPDNELRSVIDQYNIQRIGASEESKVSEVDVQSSRQFGKTSTEMANTYFLQKIMPTIVPKIQIKSPLIMSKKTSVLLPKVFYIERDIEVQYKKVVYIKKYYSLKIIIEPKGKKSKPAKGEKTHKTDSLNFAALEEEPQITVELKFDKEEFKTNKKKETQKLHSKDKNVFDFLIKPLKAEDCGITIVISYKNKLTVTNKITEKIKINKTITPSQGNPTQEVSEQTTIIPQQSSEQDVEIKTINLAISVKSFLRLNPTQLDILKKSVFGIAGLALLLYKVLINELVGFDALVGSISLLAPMFGVSGFDALQDKLKGNKTESEES